MKKEIRADKFACDNAKDIDVLQGGLQFVNYIDLNNLDKNDYIHPSASSRAQKIVDEIKHRRIAENTCPVLK